MATLAERIEAAFDEAGEALCGRHRTEIEAEIAGAEGSDDYGSCAERHDEARLRHEIALLEIERLKLLVEADKAQATRYAG